MSASFAKILVTTRNDNVVQIMQIEPTFNIGCLSDKQCWQLFKHYAFGGINQNKSPKLVEIGKQIMNKCGMLPLAVKSIASLLRYEAEEESWRDILESELWKLDVRNEIFPHLQISYACLPTYLKSYFLYCSMFSKDHVYNAEEMVKLWMSQGFIESKGNKTAKNIGFEYAQQLCQRSLFEERHAEFVPLEFKLHDIVHDLVRGNSENGCFSIEINKLPILPNVLYHLYIANLVNFSIPFDKFTSLRTHITCCNVQKNFSTFDLSMAPNLRALDIAGSSCDFLSSIGNLKHLRYLSLCDVNSKTLPESICSLYNLQILTLSEGHFKELPNNIGDLVSLEELRIEYCWLRVLPVSLCRLKALRKLCLMQCSLLKELPSDMGSLTNLQILKIRETGVSYLPPSLSKFVGIQTLKVTLKCHTIGWLKNFPDLGGTLCLSGLNNISNFMDVQCANLTSMHNLEYFIPDWYYSPPSGTDGSVLQLIIKQGQNLFLENQSCFLMASLQPHPNLTKLEINCYNRITFPQWIGSLCKLKYLKISSCCSLEFLKAELLPLELEELEIYGCHQLVFMPGVQKLKSLVKLSIIFCGNLCSFTEPSLELTMRTGVGSVLGLRNLSSLRSLQILYCFKLQVMADEFFPAEPCNVEVSGCPGLREWCLKHGINYKVRG